MKMKVRLALRVEGNFWNAYLAEPNTMDGATLIGSILIGPAKRNPAIKDAFMAVMQQALVDAIEATTGEVPDYFDIEPAPEAERSGSA